VILGYNQRLLAKIDNLKATKPDVTVYFWDAHAQFTKILDSPTTYGFRDATSVGSAANQFWSDVYHPGSAPIFFFVEFLLNSTQQAPTNSSLSKLERLYWRELSGRPAVDTCNQYHFPYLSP